MKLRLLSILSLLLWLPLCWASFFGFRYDLTPRPGPVQRQVTVNSAGIVLTSYYPRGPSLGVHHDFGIPGIGFSYFEDANGPQAVAGPWVVTPIKTWRIGFGWLLPLLSIAPFLNVIRRIRSGPRGADPTRRRACGYDLRATPDRCPECGTIPPGTIAAG